MPADSLIPKIRGTRTVHDGWASFLIADVTLPDGHEVTREIEDHGEAVCVLPYDAERRVALVIRQFRAAPFFAAALPELLEAPAGLLDEADPHAGARREAFEETGVQLGALEPVATVWTMPGVSTERMHLFLGPYGQADRTGAGGGLAEEHEGITVAEVRLADLAAQAEAGELADLKTYTLVLALRLRRPDLFD
ncbi:nudix-type nucleoside diphosphatase (YffH/AdpP family) [Methylorubrum rhodinum]|uniref:GDP-mannose pyrophosphatase n=1 Tax=Methylorubrum rhodinum TaxID=29428 RepID=A0A840ZG32_9HYPH|nr:nudix-type nucleoside diphosphatase (YffH/AdpP family) [Methylorubrum rhodinum]